MTDYDMQGGGWRLDRKVPIALIFAIVAQTFLFGWIASSFNGRVEGIERYIADAKVSSAAAVVLERDRSDRLVRLETLMESIQRSVNNIERKLEAPSQRAQR